MELPQRALPTLPKLGSTVDPNIDVQAVANSWTCQRVVDLLLDDVWWRDMLALTWDFHTFEGKNAVSKFLEDQLKVAEPQLHTFRLRQDLVQLLRPYEDIAWIQAFFDFDTNVGHASGVFRLVPLPDGSWKAHLVYTNLENLKGFPELIGSLRNYEPNHGKWAAKREREMEFLDEEPTVVVVGGGQAGLGIAARLKMLGLNALVVERNERIGDNWRKRYAALCLHDPGTIHMPYLPFPPSWPVFTPALKLADWLESYAHSLELNVWTSATVVSIMKETGDSGKRWSVRVERGDGRKRTFKVNHVVFALGFGSGVPRIPDIPGQERPSFKGQILHSSKHKLARDHSGQKVVVIGSGTSDVTMVQRSPTYVMSAKQGLPRLFCNALFWDGGPPTDIADRINGSFPNYLAALVQQRVTKAIAEADKEILDGLRKVGFKLTFGENGCGFRIAAFQRAGGYYLARGTSNKFTPTGLLFEDGSTLDADVIVFATGYGDARTAYYELIKDADLHDKIQPIWGLDEEGELNSVWREIGGRGKKGQELAGLWCGVGNLAYCRFHSKHLALQIKAWEENILGVRYPPGN
ncbi:FAD/NAD(P)-binding domain-containing protein [Melanogaster broomeanus]|nr:FAD/NAD(P)-binding domain-containing protein [Melanogaster broomeanus]